MNDAPTIEVTDLRISVSTPGGDRVPVVDGVSFSVAAGGTLGIVGESGSGKTMTCRAIVRLLPAGAEIDGGSIRLHGEELVTAGPARMRRLRGSDVSMVLQDPMTALDPCYTIENQLVDVLRKHRGLHGDELALATREALESVHLDSTPARLRQFPHQLSGGMRQRVTSAIALAGRPSLLIADEPTTALDVTTQARYLRLLDTLRRENGFSLILIAHDLYVVRQACERVAVMYAGQIVEEGPTAEVFRSPRHPYTRALLNSIPKPGGDEDLEAIPGQAPDPGSYPPGCRFAPRCRFARAECSAPQQLTKRGPAHEARCAGTEADGWVTL